MGDVNINRFTGVDPIPIQPVEISKIDKVAPVAVHIKELNQVEPLSIESLRVDQVRNLDPLRIDHFNVTHIPTVNLSLSTLPSVGLNVLRVPPVAIAVRQEFELPSQYTVHTRFMGFEVLRLEVSGRTKVIPKDCFRREQSRTHAQSFPSVAAIGNPAIPTRVIEKCVEVISRTEGGCSEMGRHRAAVHSQAGVGTQPSAPLGSIRRAQTLLKVGVPRFNYSISAVAEAADSNVSGVSF